MDVKLTVSIEEMKHWCNLQKLSRRMAWPSHQFCKKGCEMQFNFNLDVTDFIIPAKKELKRLVSSTPGQRTLTRVTDFSEEGVSALRIRQRDWII